ncbi:unnamed protein product [Spirodela intermedia]|uniref:Uncharacterized protein n=1 Tax=Spirodela intermedia TaxID=51605 RepID=A0A7I8KEV0_SPIIN|nr:unnamed protein product [Spirodela intermedia]
MALSGFVFLNLMGIRSFFLSFRLTGSNYKHYALYY